MSPRQTQQKTTKIKLGLLAIGSELLDGRVLDSNTHWLSQNLFNQGFEVHQRLVCNDSIADICSALKHLESQQVLAIIICGGIGPTTDDLTREAVAKYINRRLILDQQAVSHIKTLLTTRGRNFNSSNEKQAYRPEGSKIINNPHGTAPGFIVEHIDKNKKLVIYSLPGIPSEMQLMFKETVLVDLSQRYQTTPIEELTFKIFGLPESELNEKLKPLALDTQYSLAFAVSFPTIDLITRKNQLPFAGDLEQQIEKAIGKEFIFARKIEKNLPEVLIDLLRTKKLKLAVAESCTGGLIGDLLTAIPGSSDVFLGGIVSYSDSVKLSLLGVSTTTLEKHGAVSQETVAEMAKGVRHALDSDIAISVSGVAGPSGGSIENPVGTVYIGLADQNHCFTKKFNFAYGRNENRRISAFAALNWLRLHLNE